MENIAFIILGALAIIIGFGSSFFWDALKEYRRKKKLSGWDANLFPVPEKTPVGKQYQYKRGISLKDGVLTFIFDADSCSSNRHYQFKTVNDAIEQYVECFAAEELAFIHRNLELLTEHKSNKDLIDELSSQVTTLTTELKDLKEKLGE